jgi:sugar/nucleoside kinase (ribokinase family)
MDYAELTELLQREPPRCEVTAFPDGSVDTYYEIHGSDDERLDSHTAFGEQIAGDADTFSITQTTTEPGGQAVNIAQQTHALGDKTWLFGHLDHSIFDHLDVEIASMGAPASMFIYEFDDGDLMLADDSADMPEWSLSDLRTAAGDAFAARLTVDVVCCANWASFDAMTDALDQLTAHEFDGNLFVFDPGDLTAAEPASITRLCETLTDLERSYDIVLSADSDEIAQFMTAVGIENDLGEATLTRLRERIDITGVVCHGHPTATAAMADGYVVFPTIEADGKKRQTGAGDRFSAGLAHGLAAGFGWETALGLGNLCASYHVEYGETGTREALTKYVEQA